MSAEKNKFLSPLKTADATAEENSAVIQLNGLAIRTYKRRWFIVAVLSLMVFSNSMSRIAFGPIAYTSATFYDSEVAVINWFAVVYMIFGIPCCVAVTWIMGKFGLRFSILLASWLHCAGCILRILSGIVAIPRTEKLALVFTGHVMSAISQPFLMFAPTKVAAIWFPNNQRALANTIMVSSNPLGIMAANILSPLLVRKPKDILLMLCVYAVPSVIGTVLVTFGLKQSSPPLPPSLSAEKEPEPFSKRVKTLTNNRQYWILVFSIGGAVGIFTALTVFLEQILCPWGYTDFFAGVICGTCLVVAGVIGALIAGTIADKTRHFVVVAKASFLLCVGSISLFTIFQNKLNQRAIIALGCGLIGFFGMPLLPLGNKLVVETTYPVETATSTGPVLLSGQLQGMVLILGLQAIATPISPEFVNITRCQNQGASSEMEKPTKIRNMTTPCFVLLSYSAFIGLIFIFFYRTANRRINLEKQAIQTNIHLNEEIAAETNR